MKVLITLEFEGNEEPTQEDVENYLNELINDNSLNAVLIDNDNEYIKDI